MGFRKEERDMVTHIYNMPVFSGLENSEQLEIVTLLHPFSATALEELIKNPSDKDKIYFILAGRVEATLHDDRHITYVYEAGMAVNIIALYNKNYLLSQLSALTDSSGYWMSIEDFQAIQQKFPAIAFKILKNILKNICRDLRKENASAIETIESAPGSQRATNLFEPNLNKPSREAYEFVRSLPLFQKFTDEELNQLLDNMKEWKIQRNNILFSEGEPGRSCFLLVKGSIEVSVNHGGKNFRLAICGPGSLLGEVSLIHLGLRSATCVANEDIMVLELSKKEFNYLFNSYSSLSYKFLEVIAYDLISKYVSSLSSSEMSDKKILMEF